MLFTTTLVSVALVVASSACAPSGGAQQDPGASARQAVSSARSTRQSPDTAQAGKRGSAVPRGGTSAHNGSSVTYIFDVRRYVAPNPASAFAGGDTGSVTETVLMRRLPNGNSLVVRTGEYWGPHIQYEYELHASAEGWSIVARRVRYDNGGGSQRKTYLCPASGNRLTWPVAPTTRASWRTSLDCRADQYLVEIESTFLGADTVSAAGRHYRVLTVRRTERQRYPEAREILSGSVDVTESIAPDLGVPVRWERVSRDSSGRMVARDIGVLSSIEPAQP